MRKVIGVGLAAMLACGLAIADDKSSDELKKDAKHAEINEVADETLQRLFAEDAGAKELYDKALGWAVFDNAKIAFGLSGGGGRGVAVSKNSGRRAYMKMGTAGVGIGIGGQKYQVVFLFQDEQTFTNFVENKYTKDEAVRSISLMNEPWAMIT